MTQHIFTGDGENEWELSKENVQPLRQGRKFANLAAALQPHKMEQMVKLKTQRQIFETELRSYSGDDPLDVWHRYIQWTEQNFPKGGKESNIQQLIENCITTFKDDDRYKNDIRLIDIWIKFTFYCNDPLEIYSFLFNQGIGCSLARFYDTWASELEKLGNTKKADMVYTLGIENGAQPLDLLKRQHSEFQARVARGVADHMTDDIAMATTDHDVSEPHRTALGQLKAKGKKAMAPVNRTGIPVRHGSAGPSHQTPASNGRQTFAVFGDENVASTAIPVQTKEWATVPGKETNRENEQNPGHWMGARLKQRHQPVVPVNELSSHSRQPDFAVHQDITPETPVQVPRKCAQVDQVLSARKKDVDPFHFLQHQQEKAISGTMTVSMYDKHKVYAGVNEFSFEQIRATDWFRRQRQLEEKRLEDERRHVQELRNERLAQTVQEQQCMMQEQHRMIQQLKQNQEMLKTMMVSAKNQQQDASIDKDTNQDTNTSSQNSSIRCGNSFTGDKTRGPPSSSEGSLRNESSFRGSVQTEATKTISDGRFQASVPSTLKESISAESSVLSLSAHASNESSLNLSNGRRGWNISRSGWLSAPSPTVNTKEAMMVVHNMFSTKIWREDTLSETDYALDKVDNSLTQPPVTGAVPFTVFEESRFIEQDEKFCQDVVMESDKENLIPTAHEMASPMQAGLTMKQQSTGSLPLDSSKKMLRHVSPNNEPMEAGLSEPSAGRPFRVHESIEMDGIEVTCGNYDMANNDDMTFAPTSCSTQNFTAAACLASTPFNILADMAPLPEPPLSTIKPAVETTGATRGQHQPGCPRPDDATSSSDSNDKRRSERLSIYVQQENNLSTIMEGSNEGKSHSSASSGGSTMCGGATTVEWSRHCSHSTTNDLTANQSKKVSDESHAFTTKFNHTLDLDCTMHNIDTTNYVPTFGDASMAADPFEMSIAINPNDPFDEDLVAEFLSSLETPIETRPNYCMKICRLPEITVGLINVLGNDTYLVDCKLGEGAYAKVYQATMLDALGIDTGRPKVLKVQKPACQWEFYIVTELQQRLADLNAHVDVSPSVMSIDCAYFYKDGSCLVSDLHKYGTLLELVNAGKKLGKAKPQSEMVSVCLVIEMLHIVEQMHRCNFIHGDIKPDNFLLRGLKPLTDANGPAEMLTGHTRALQLIDFGRSIDMTMFQPGTTFTVKVETEGFQCIEMKTDKPWTYQTDLFGVIGTVHVLLFGKYMQVYQEAGHWRTTNAFKRHWACGEQWQSLFDSLLNIPSCDQLPNLASLREGFEQAFISHVNWQDFCKEIGQLEHMLQSL